MKHEQRNNELDEELEELTGEIDYVLFTNQENGFTVAKVRMKGNRGLVSVVGCMLDPMAGQTITARGNWHEDPKFGTQFKAQSCQAALPTSASGIRAYLQSGMIHGVGKEYANRIVDFFGEETLDILDNEPERLLEVKGIGKRKLKKIMASWEEHQGMKDLMIFLQSQGVSAAYAVRMFKFYGDNALRTIKENPYKPAMDIPGIGFLTADTMAQKLGFAEDCDLRVEAGVYYVMQQMSDKGHVYLPRKDLYDRCREVLGVDPDLVDKAVEVLVHSRRLRLEDLGAKGDGIYLASYHIAECGIADKLLYLLAAPKTVRPIEAERAIGWVQDRLGITLATKQAQAIRQAAENKVLVITGGPGTGKTTIINAILRIFTELKTKALLAAPTGRAAKRMSETTGHEAKTIHRLLEYSPMEGAFNRDDSNPLKAGLLIVDEASMIDTVLMYHLLKAVSAGTTLILVGDVNQLPSVGPGNVLGDIIASESVPVVELNEIFRQAKESSIIVNAHAINSGKIPYLESSRERLTDFYFIRREDPEQAVDMIVDLVQNHIPRRFGLDPIDDIQVLTPMHKGAAGAINLNLRLQQALNPQIQYLARGGRQFRLHDKVMQTRNNYDKDVFNGDMGRVVYVDHDASKLVVNFDDKDVDYDVTELDEVMPAYAVSVHKSQGSEYPAVVIPVLTQHFILLQRNLIYTAITRGKKLVVLVGTKKALSIAVRNNATHQRYTHLSYRLYP